MSRLTNNPSKLYLFIAGLITIVVAAIYAGFIIKLDLSLDGKMGKVDNSLFRSENTVILLIVGALLMFQIGVLVSNLIQVNKDLNILLGINVFILLGITPVSIATLHPLGVSLIILLILSCYIYAHNLKNLT